MNGRTAQQVDYKPDVHMNRYIDIPEYKTKTTRSKPPKSEWLNDKCKESKRKFYETKRTFLADKTDENKILF